MTFNEKLNSYIKKLNCSSKKLAETSKMSESIISRYRSGQRIPKENSNQIKILANAIYEISKENNHENLKKSEILKDLNSCASKNNNFDYDNFSKNLNILITSLGVNTNDMAKYIKFDASHISRIRYCKTKPSDPNDFSMKVSNYIVSKYNNVKDNEKILTFMNIPIKNYTDKELFNLINNWIINNKNDIKKDYVDDFLKKLDNFNLSDYIKAIKFDDIKVPSIPFYKARRKNYYGIDEMKEAEIDFFKATIFSKSKEDIFMYSQMPMEDMAKDTLFGKKWMYAIAVSLKKGLHLNIVHNLDRPFNEIMLGLESWIPIYMTGQISPYYFKEQQSDLFQHINYTSGAAILTGECINGFHNKGKYYITSNSKETSYYKENAKLILKKAKPLMNIYRVENKKDYEIFQSENIKKINVEKRILSSLPIFSIDDDLLLEILKRNDISKQDVKTIMSYKKKEENTINEILNTRQINDVVFDITKKEFYENESYLTLENIFYNKKIKYTYDEFKKHLNSLKKFSKNNKNYNLKIKRDKTFKNINISIINNQYVIISKVLNPTIHFVINHPKLVNAINNFKPLVKE